MSDNAKLRISLKDGEFELSGSELFVTQQINNFKELIVDSLKDQKFEFNKQDVENNEISISNGPTALPSPKGQPTAHDFSHVFYVDGEVVKIIKKAPGNNNAQKSIATALIYLWAKKSLGANDVTYPEVRELCREQACLDESNFSSQMKSARSYLVVEGSGKFQKLKLTIPGKEKAEEIIRELQG